MMPRDSNKKRKLNPADGGIKTSKPSAFYRPGKGRSYTVSVALPGSIIANAVTHDLKTQLAGQIGRCLAVFEVDEVVVFNDGSISRPPPPHANPNSHALQRQDAETGYTAFADPNHFLLHILSYLETPPYLRRALFPHHPNLISAGSLPSLDMPHHLRADEWCRYREGVTVASSDARPRSKKLSHEPSTFVTTGLAAFPEPAQINADIPPNTRVTLKFATESAPQDLGGLHAEAVSQTAPKEETGYYWGYVCRSAESLSKAFTECEFDGGYDFCIGTSERGEHVGQLLERVKRPGKEAVGNGKAGFEDQHAPIPTWRHLLVVFGGVAGLEQAVKADGELKAMGVYEPRGLFDAWVNLVERQGSRTIRTEESMWIGMAMIRDMVLVNEKRLESQ